MVRGDMNELISKTRPSEANGAQHEASRGPCAGILAAALALASTACAPAPESAPPRPANLVVVSLDTLRRDHLGCYGADFATPRLDRFASEGALFESAFAPTPITLPTHASLLTGTTPPRHGLVDNALFALEPAAITLAETVKGAGFTTGAFVSAFVLDAQFGLAQGFDEYDDRFQIGFGGTLGVEERSATATTDAVLAWLDRRPPGPLFLWVHYFDPHRPWRAPEPFASAAPTPYAAEIQYLDHELGRLLDGLAARGLFDTSAIVIAADHGEGLGEHGEETHGAFVYQSTVAVPLLVRAPGVEPGRRIAGNVSLVDVAPTLLDLVGIESGAHVQGVSLAPALLEGAALPERPVYLETRLGAHSFGWAPLFAVVAGADKYIEAPRPELYDLSRDPRELADRFASDSSSATRRADELGRLRTALAGAGPRWWRHHTSASGDREQLEALGYAVPSVTPTAEAIGAARDPKDAIGELALLDEAALARERGDGAATLAAYEKLLAENPNNWTALERYGSTLVALERYADAIATLERLRSRGLFPGRALFDLAIAYGATGDESTMLALIAELRRDNPRFVPAHQYFARYHDAQGDVDAALEGYRAVLANWHGDPAFRAGIEARVRELEGR
jgi:arylsulfatase A-like enzyme